MSTKRNQFHTVLCAGILSLALLALTTNAHSQQNDYPLEEFKATVKNIPSLQRGAKYFVNYCLSCHSAQYSRYNRVGKDLNISDKMVAEKLIFTKQRAGDLMKVSMTDEEALQWFGSVAPDLTLVTRRRSPDWVYNYLKSFYLDDSRKMGVNNTVFQNTAMPHVLWRLQGWQKLTEVKEGEDGVGKLEIASPGQLSPEQYDRVVSDIVNFLSYLGEPSAEKRKNVGIGVILFLLLALVIAYFLKREYWRGTP